MAQQASASKYSRSKPKPKPAAKAKTKARGKSKALVSLETATTAFQWLLNNDWTKEKRKMNLKIAQLFIFSIEDSYGVEKLIENFAHHRNPTAVLNPTAFQDEAHEKSIKIFVVPFMVCNSNNLKQLKHDFPDSNVKNFNSFCSHVREINKLNDKHVNVYMAVFVGKTATAKASGKTKIAAQQGNQWHVRTIVLMVDTTRDGSTYWGLADCNNTSIYLVYNFCFAILILLLYRCYIFIHSS